MLQDMIKYTIITTNLKKYSNNSSTKHRFYATLDFIGYDKILTVNSEYINVGTIDSSYDSEPFSIMLKYNNKVYFISGRTTEDIIIRLLKTHYEDNTEIILNFQMDNFENEHAKFEISADGRQVQDRIDFNGNATKPVFYALLELISYDHTNVSSKYYG